MTKNPLVQVNRRISEQYADPAARARERPSGLHRLKLFLFEKTVNQSLPAILVLSLKG
jgi:hypothetical protein